MKRIFSILLAVLFICATMVVTSAQEVDVAQTGVNTENFDKVANYIDSNGTKINGKSTITCTYRTDTVDLVRLSQGEIQLQFSKSTSKIDEKGTITLYKTNDSARGIVENTMYVSGLKVSTKVDGRFDMKTVAEDQKIDFTEGKYYGPDDADLQTSCVASAKAQMILHIATVNVCLSEDLGCTLYDIYKEDTSNNTNNNTGDNTEDDTDDNTGDTNNESTPDSEEPTTPQPAQSGNSATSNQTSQSSPHAIQTGANTYAVVMIIMAAGLILFVTASFLKKKTN